MVIMYKVTHGEEVCYGVDKRAEPVNDVFLLKSYLLRSYIRFLKGQKSLNAKCIDQPYMKWMDWILDNNTVVEIVDEVKQNPQFGYNDQHLKNSHENLCLAVRALSQNRHKKYNEKYKCEMVEKEYVPYYEKNKERLNQKNECPCGGSYTTKNKAIHHRSRRHIDYVEGRVGG